MLARKPLTRSPFKHRITRRGRERLKLNSQLHAQASLENWHDRCEVAPILAERGITDQPCFGPLTFAHSVKAHKRGRDPILAREVCRACETHHFLFLDLQRPAVTKEIVLEAIARRNNA